MAKKLKPANKTVETSEKKLKLRKELQALHDKRYKHLRNLLNVSLLPGVTFDIFIRDHYKNSLPFDLQGVFDLSVTKKYKDQFISIFSSKNLLMNFSTVKRLQSAGLLSNTRIDSTFEKLQAFTADLFASSATVNTEELMPRYFASDTFGAKSDLWLGVYADYFFDICLLKEALPTYESLFNCQLLFERALEMPQSYYKKGVLKDISLYVSKIKKIPSLDNLGDLHRGIIYTEDLWIEIQSNKQIVEVVQSFEELESRYLKELAEQDKGRSEYEMKKQIDKELKQIEEASRKLQADLHKRFNLLITFGAYEFDETHTVVKRIHKNATFDYSRIKNQSSSIRAKGLSLRMQIAYREIIDLAQLININFEHLKSLGDAVFHDDILRVYERLFLTSDENSKGLKLSQNSKSKISIARENFSLLMSMLKEGSESPTLAAAAENGAEYVFDIRNPYTNIMKANEINELNKIFQQQKKEFMQQKKEYIKLLKDMWGEETHKLLRRLPNMPLLLAVLSGDERTILKAHNLFHKFHSASYLSSPEADYEVAISLYEINKIAETVLTDILGVEVSFAGEKPKKPELEIIEENELEEELDDEADLGEVHDIEEETVVETILEPQSIMPIAPLPKAEGDIQIEQSPFDNDKVFQRLLQETDQFLLEALVCEPPQDAFKCALQLQQGYPIQMTIANDNGHTSYLSLDPETNDLDRALNLKIAVQSYVLNNNDLIFPYRSAVKHGSGNITVRLDEPMPISEPEKSVLLRGGGIYRAGMQFTERRRPVEVSFSLGVASKPENIDLARERMQLLMEYLQDERSVKRWVTKREGIDFVKSMYPASEWDNTESFYVPGYEDITQITALPSVSSDIRMPVRLSRALLRYEDGVNPSYILNYKIHVNDNICRGAGIRLHTASEDLAVTRAHEAIESITNTFKAKAENGSAWSLDSDGQWVSVDESERGNKIDFKGLRDIFNDAKHFETDILIDCNFESSNENTFRLSLVRGGNDNAPQIVKSLNGDVIEFQIKAKDKEAASSFIQAVNKTFTGYVQDAYNTRTPKGLRKTRQKYHTQTAPRLLERAIETHQGKFENIISFEAVYS